MVKQVFDVESYWKVIVYYNADYNFFDDILYELRMIDFPEKFIKKTYQSMVSHQAFAVTCSSSEYHTSIVIFNTHSSEADYINSIVHEAEHIKQAMFKAYQVEDAGEPPAYTVGYLVMRMYEVFCKILNN